MTCVLYWDVSCIGIVSHQTDTVSYSPQIAENFSKLEGSVYLNEIFYNQLFQLCLRGEIAAKPLYVVANDGMEQLMGTGGKYCYCPKNFHFESSRLLKDPMSWQPLTFD